MGRVLQDDRFIGSVTPGKFVNYGYTLDGSLQFVTTPPLKTIGYTYNGAGRAIQALDSTDGINFVTNAAYAPPGGLTTMTMGAASGFNGIVTTNAFNDRLQPILLSAASPSGTVFSECFDFHLGVAVNTTPCSFSASAAGNNGNVNQIVNNRTSTRTANYTYDSLNRIASAYSSGTLWGETFTIDSWGNMTNENPISGKTAHEGLNQSAGTNNQLTGFGYDAAGNMTSNGSTSYVYDAENRLIWTSGYRYLYDGNGQRVEKCVAATVTTACPTSGTNGTLYWRGTGSDPLDESDLSGNALEEYVFFNGQRVARRDVSTNNVHYYFSDHLGSHGVVENATGTACEQDIDYYPYGGVEHDYCPSVGQNYKFTGKERDSESGLDHFGARHNASALGRFMSADPKMISKQRALDPQQWNMYAYTRNTPLIFVDPDGKETQVAIGGRVADNVFGHASIIINGKAYSYGTNDTKGAKGKQDWGVDAKAFLQAEAAKGRQTDLLKLNITPEQEKTLQQHLDSNNPNAQGAAPYSINNGNSCVTQVENPLVETGIISTSTDASTAIHNGAGASGPDAGYNPSVAPGQLEQNLQNQPGLVQSTDTVGQSNTSFLGSLLGTIKTALGLKSAESGSDGDSSGGSSN